MSNNELFTEINPSDEASLSGGYGGRGLRSRGPSAAAANTDAFTSSGFASANADAEASGRNVFTNTFSIAEVDLFGNSFAVASSIAVAFA